MTWPQIIDEAEARGYFTKEERMLANEWPTCACGQLDTRIPRDDFNGAREVLARIERRAAAILVGVAK